MLSSGSTLISLSSLTIALTLILISLNKAPPWLWKGCFLLPFKTPYWHLWHNVLYIWILSYFKFLAWFTQSKAPSANKIHSWQVSVFQHPNPSRQTYLSMSFIQYSVLSAEIWIVSDYCNLCNYSLKNLCIWVFWPHVHLCTIYVSSAHGCYGRS